jgi:hypothetical protein
VPIGLSNLEIGHSGVPRRAWDRLATCSKQQHISTSPSIVRLRHETRNTTVSAEYMQAG